MKHRNALPPIGMTIRGLVFRAGGYSAVAAACGIGTNSVYRWSETIPLKHVPALSRLTGLPPEKLRPDLGARKRSLLS